MAVNQKLKAGTVIKFCACESKFQDQKYGQHQRVFNVGQKADTCTVCGRKVN